MEQLDDAMIFFLVSLPSYSYQKLCDVYKKFSEETLKGQHVPRSKKGTVSKPLDLKGSKFKCLRGVPHTEISRLLLELSEESLSLAEMSSECNSLKQLQKVQTAFMKGTNCNTWEECQEKYSSYATAEQLEPFKKLDFSKTSKLPEQFLKFCQRIMENENDAESSCSSTQSDTVFVTCFRDRMALFWKEDPLQINPTNLQLTMKVANVNAFPGFSLSVFDIPKSLVRCMLNKCRGHLLSILPHCC